MSNPAVITLENTSSRRGKFKRFVIEDNIGESVHLHIDNMRMDFSVKEFLNFSKMVRESLGELNLLHGYSIDKFDEHFLKECLEFLPKLQKIKIEEVKLSELRCIVHSNFKNIFDYLKLVSVVETPAFKYLQGDKKVFLSYRQFNYFGINNEDRLLKLLESIGKQGYPFDDKYLILFNGQNTIRDGQHRAAILANKYGPEHKVKIMRFYFKGNQHKIKINLDNLIFFIKEFGERVYKKLQ